MAIDLQVIASALNIIASLLAIFVLILTLCDLDN